MDTLLLTLAIVSVWALFAGTVLGAITSLALGFLTNETPPLIGVFAELWETLVDISDSFSFLGTLVIFPFVAVFIVGFHLGLIPAAIAGHGVDLLVDAWPYVTTLATKAGKAFTYLFLADE